VISVLDESTLPVILNRKHKLTLGFWLEGARNWEEAELVSPQTALLGPLGFLFLGFVIPACSKVSLLNTSVALAFPLGDNHVSAK
jgi:hypothetical protein